MFDFAHEHLGFAARFSALAYLRRSVRLIRVAQDSPRGEAGLVALHIITNMMHTGPYHRHRFCAREVWALREAKAALGAACYVSSETVNFASRGDPPPGAAEEEFTGPRVA